MKNAGIIAALSVGAYFLLQPKKIYIADMIKAYGLDDEPRNRNLFIEWILTGKVKGQKDSKGRYFAYKKDWLAFEESERLKRMQLA